MGDVSVKTTNFISKKASDVAFCYSMHFCHAKVFMAEGEMCKTLCIS